MSWALAATLVSLSVLVKGQGSNHLFQLALQQADAGDIVAAERSLLEVLRLEPAYAEAHHRLAQLRASTGNFAGAVQSCAEVVRLTPASGGAYANLAYMQMLDGHRLAEAESNYRVALRLEPSNARAHSGLAEIMHMQGDVATAEQSWRAALRLDKTLPQVHESLGLLYEEQGRDEEAERRYRAALKLEPSQGALHRKLGGLQQKRGKLREAEKRYRAAIRLSPEEAEKSDTRKWLGLLLAARGEAEEAAAVLEEAAELRKASGRPPVTLVMNLKDEREKEFISARRSEAKEFRAFCRDSAALQSSLAAELPKALKAVRRMEDSGKWLAAYLTDSFAVFGFTENKLPSASAYGAVWFESFREALTKAQPHLETSPASGPVVEPAGVLVLGSALGEQCIFAVALGMRCIGYELLCNSTVQPARKLVAKHGLSSWIDLRCGDAAEAEGLQTSELVFLNDYTWNSALSYKVQRRFAQELPKGAALVSFNTHAWDQEAEEKLKLVETVAVLVSWGRVQVQIRVKQ